MDIKISTKDLARELGKHGGESTFKKYGQDHFKKISKLGLEARRTKAKTKKFDIDLTS
jgi:hypothetical protein